MTERTPEDYAALELARRRILARRDADQDGDGEGRWCPACGGDLLPLGRLGRVDWYRCRACGLDSHGPDPAP